MQGASARNTDLRTSQAKVILKRLMEANVLIINNYRRLNRGTLTRICLSQESYVVFEFAQEEKPACKMNENVRPFSEANQPSK